MAEDETRWLEDEEQAAWRALLGVNAALHTRLDAELRAAHGMGMDDYEVLVNLSEAPDGALRMAELAHRLGLSPSGLTRRLDGLVADGLVERRACPSDRRGSLAVVTPAGMDELRRVAPTHVAGVRRYVIESAGPDGLAALSRVLGRIRDSLAAAGPFPAGCGEQTPPPGR